MRLDFNVLWVDDQPDAVEAQSIPLIRMMEEQGFLFKRSLCKSIDEVAAAIGDDIFADEIDLVLVDWDLGAAIHGEEVISRIREVVPFRDVIFYSAQKTVAELRKLAYENSVEGVYCSSREELVDEVNFVFESIIKKVLDLDHTRGIVMGATSDIDHAVNECLFSVHKKLDGKGQEALVAEAFKRIEEKLKGWTKDIEKLRSQATMAAVMEAHFIFAANDRLRMLLRVIESDRTNAHKGAAIGKYIKEVVPERNTMAHVRPSAKGKSRVVVNTAGEELGVEEMRELRRKILAFRQDFYTLLDGLKDPA